MDLFKFNFNFFQPLRGLWYIYSETYYTKTIIDLEIIQYLNLRKKLEILKLNILIYFTKISEQFILLCMSMDVSVCVRVYMCLCVHAIKAYFYTDMSVCACACVSLSV